MLILLDIDGVMVQAASWKPLEILKDGFPSFGYRAVASLQRIIAETHGSVVLTTSHKSTYSLTKWEEIFKYRGINTAIQKLEDNVNSLNRKDEVLNWLDKNPNLSNFVIIDDDKSLHALPVHIKNRFVSTNSLIGLNDECATAAIAVLNNKSILA